MPYIEEDRRQELNRYITALDDKLGQMGDVGGDMNYVITILFLRKFLRTRKYMTMETMFGTFLGVIMEFYRRTGGMYEDGAIARNGDIKEYTGI